MIKINILLVVGRIENGEYIPTLWTGSHALKSMYGLQPHDVFREYGQGHKDKIKVRVVTKKEDIGGVRLEDWIVLEDIPGITDHIEVKKQKINEFISKIKLRGICD